MQRLGDISLVSGPGFLSPFNKEKRSQDQQQLQGGNMPPGEKHLNATVMEIVGSGLAMGQNALEGSQGGQLDWSGFKLGSSSYIF